MNGRPRVAVRRNCAAVRRRFSIRRGCENTLEDEQKEFFREVEDEDGEFRGGRRGNRKCGGLQDARQHLHRRRAPRSGNSCRQLTSRDNSLRIDAWLKNTPIGFYSLEYAWKKGNKPKRGEFSPDFFIKQGEDSVRDRDQG